MAVTSRWFPPIFALLQAVRHLGMIAYDYWRATQNYRHFDAAEFIHKDLARSFFEPYGFCGAWTRYGFHEDGVKTALRVAQTVNARQMATKP